MQPAEQFNPESNHHGMPDLFPLSDENGNPIEFSAPSSVEDPTLQAQRLFEDLVEQMQEISYAVAEANDRVASLEAAQHFVIKRIESGDFGLGEANREEYERRATAVQLAREAKTRFKKEVDNGERPARDVTVASKILFNAEKQREHLLFLQHMDAKKMNEVLDQASATLQMAKDEYAEIKEYEANLRQQLIELHSLLNEDEIEN